MQRDGWSFLEMVGEAHSKPDPDGRELRRSDSTGSLTVYAMNTGIDGHGSREQEWKKTFKQEGFEFLEVKIMTSPADGYSLVFRRSQSPSERGIDKQMRDTKLPNKTSILTPDPLRVQPVMIIQPLTKKSERALGQA